MNDCASFVALLQLSQGKDGEGMEGFMAEPQRNLAESRNVALSRRLASSTSERTDEGSLRTTYLRSKPSETLRERKTRKRDKCGFICLSFRLSFFPAESAQHQQHKSSEGCSEKKPFVMYYIWMGNIALCVCWSIHLTPGLGICVITGGITEASERRPRYGIVGGKVDVLLFMSMMSSEQPRTADELMKPESSLGRIRSRLLFRFSRVLILRFLLLHGCETRF